MEDAVQISGQVEDRADPGQGHEKFSRQDLMKDQPAKAGSIPEKDAHAQNTDGQAELDRIFDGRGNVLPVPPGLFLGDDRKEHGGDGGSDRVGEQEEGQGHAGQDSVEA